ncbi:MAG TPA: V-type ATP synthase subunit F [bacterium]|nr:V-type ATP synthase subunit F [bacterium]
MGKIIFVGEATSIEFFKNFGFEIIPATSKEEAKEILDKKNYQDIEVLFITEEIFDSVVFSRFVDEKKIVVIPSLKSNKGKGYKIVERLISKATGMKGE